MKLSSRFILQVLIVLLTGCSQAPTVAEVTPSLGVPSVIPTITITPTRLFPTNTSVPASIPDLIHFSNECLGITTRNFLAEMNPEKLVLKDSLVFNNKGQIFILNLETDSRKVINNYGFDPKVSPDRTKLVYINGSGTIIIIDISGNVLAQIENPDKSLHIRQWLDNQNLALEDWGRDEYGLFQASLVILNPFSKEKIEFLPNFPDMRVAPNQIMWTPSLMLPNKDLTRLIYPTREDGFALWDLSGNNKVKQLTWLVTLFEPEWSPEGNVFVQSVPLKEGEIVHFDDGLPYVGGSDILAIDQNGNISRITFLTTEYSADENFLTWSPDGQVIAFWLYLFRGAIPQLSTVNLKTGEVKDYCISPSTVSFSNAPIVWSPDGTQLAFIQETPQQNVVIADLEKQTAFYITQGADVVGWMTNDQ